MACSCSDGIENRVPTGGNTSTRTPVQATSHLTQSYSAMTSRKTMRQNQGPVTSRMTYAQERGSGCLQGHKTHRNTPTTTEAGARKTSERYLSKRVQHAKVFLADYGLRSWESSVRSPSIKHLHTAVKIHAMARPLHYSAMGIAQHNIHDSEHTVSYR